MQDRPEKLQNAHAELVGEVRHHFAGHSAHEPQGLPHLVHTGILIPGRRGLQRRAGQRDVCVATVASRTVVTRVRAVRDRLRRTVLVHEKGGRAQDNGDATLEEVGTPYSQQINIFFQRKLQKL